MALKPQIYSGQELLWIPANINLATQPASSTRILFQDGLSLIAPEFHIARRCIVASNNVVGTPTVQLVRWATSGDEATPTAVSDIVAAVDGAANADVMILELTFPATARDWIQVPNVYSLRLVGDAAGDRYEDPCMLVGFELMERR